MSVNLQQRMDEERYEMTKKKPTVSYGPGRLPPFKSPERLRDYLLKKQKEQAEEKAKKEGKE
jgi:hypothetical protein